MKKYSYEQKHMQVWTKTQMKFVPCSILWKDYTLLYAFWWAYIGKNWGWCKIKTYFNIIVQYGDLLWNFSELYNGTTRNHLLLFGYTPIVEFRRIVQCHNWKLMVQLETISNCLVLHLLWNFSELYNGTTLIVWFYHVYP